MSVRELGQEPVGGSPGQNLCPRCAHACKFNTAININTPLQLDQPTTQARSETVFFFLNHAAMLRLMLEMNKKISIYALKISCELAPVSGTRRRKCEFT